MTLLARFQSHLGSLDLPSPGRALVAVSGGPDSMALLELLARSKEAHRHELIVAHVDHGIHPYSSSIAERVRAAAEERGLAFELGTLALGQGTGETSARGARLAWLGRTATRLDAGTIYLAHHADDQAETVLMRVLEGSGTAGLAGMASVSGRLVRPLLPFTRIELAEFVHQERLPVWIDPANSDPRHLRSWLRVEVFPTLQTRLPAVGQRLRRLGTMAARQRRAWDGLLDALTDLEVRAEPDGISVAGLSLGRYDSATAEALLMAVARRAGSPLGPRRAARVLRLLEREQSGAEVPLGSGWRAELSFGRLRLARAADGDAEGEPPWVLQGAAGERQWGRWRLRWRPDTAPRRQERTAFIAWFSPVPLLVRAWHPGDRVRPLAGTGRRLVVRCFQEQHVARRRRATWPVLAERDAVVWVPGVCRSDALLPAAGTEAVRVDAEYA